MKGSFAGGADSTLDGVDNNRIKFQGLADAGGHDLKIFRIFWQVLEAEEGIHLFGFPVVQAKDYFSEAFKLAEDVQHLAEILS